MEGNHINQIFWEEGKKSGKKTKISKNLISLAGKGELNTHRYTHRYTDTHTYTSDKRTETLIGSKT